jgi:hypothetical protein
LLDFADGLSGNDAGTLGAIDKNLVDMPGVTS